MHWNYRLGFKQVDGYTSYGMVEVYYNDKEEIVFTTEGFVDTNHFEHASEVVDTLKWMLEGCSKPILDLDNLVYADYE